MGYFRCNRRSCRFEYMTGKALLTTVFLRPPRREKRQIRCPSFRNCFSHWNEKYLPAILVKSQALFLPRVRNASRLPFASSLVIQSPSIHIEHSMPSYGSMMVADLQCSAGGSAEQDDDGRSISCRTGSPPVRHAGRTSERTRSSGPEKENVTVMHLLEK